MKSKTNKKGKVITGEEIRETVATLKYSLPKNPPTFLAYCEKCKDIHMFYEKNKKGCIVIWDEPSEHAPYGRYIAGVDPYDQDKAESSESLGSFLI